MYEKFSAFELLVIFLYVMPTVLQSLLIIGGFLFAFTRMSRFPKPAAWLAGGLAVILIGRLIGWLVPFLLVRKMGAEEFGYYSLLGPACSSLTLTVGLACMIYAVFVSRKPRSPDEVRPDIGSPRKKYYLPREDSNPYSSPSAS